ncbi:MAG: hypothetical protein ACJZ83_01080 [Pseudohongiellaceae bacterium]|tara:strand:+ start:213 stop:506 length:294 start_codon:yes stop_codon:yes gene_type:complete
MSKTPVKRGRPAGMRARQLELKQTLLEHPDVPKVLEKVVRTALDDNHKNQAVAQKLVMDRLLPISTFEKAVDSREKINIVINTIRPEKEPIEGEVIE